MHAKPRREEDVGGKMEIGDVEVKKKKKNEDASCVKKNLYEKERVKNNVKKMEKMRQIKVNEKKRFRCNDVGKKMWERGAEEGRI